MTLVPIKIPWATKPPLGTPIDWSNPLTQGLVGAWALNEGGGNRILNAVTNSVGEGTGAITWGVIGAVFNGSSYFIDPTIPFISGNFAIVTNATLSDQTMETSPLCGTLQLEASSGGYSLNAETYNSTGRVGLTYGGVADYPCSILYTPDNGSNFDLALSVNNNSAVVTLNGAQQTITVGTRIALTNPGWMIGGCRLKSALTNTFSGAVRYVFLFARSLSSLEVQSLSANPWQIYQPQTIWVPTAAAAATFKAYWARNNSSLITGGLQ